MGVRLLGMRPCSLERVRVQFWLKRGVRYANATASQLIVVRSAFLFI